jgi:signal transduction histidine kinase/CheY-like chemotaxis protein
MTSLYCSFFCLFLFILTSFTTAQEQEEQQQPPQLNGTHFRITALEENGFLDITESNKGNISYSGYLIDMLYALSQPQRANFTFSLFPPSGYGSACVPPLNASNPKDTTRAYSAVYRTQYNCGASDVNDVSNNNTHSTDMYLGMYYVTPERQLRNRFSLPFVPPFSGTLVMFGTATGIPNFETLVKLQQEGIQPPACAPNGTALIDFVQTSFPGLQVRGIYGGEDDIVRNFQNGKCQVYITDGPIAAHFVLRRFQRNECMANGKPIGVIGEPMNFGLSHYAIGIQRDLPMEVANTLSYWINVLMACNPRDAEGACPDGNLATFFEGRGGTGSECGYVLYPPTDSNGLDVGPIVSIVLAAVFVMACLYTVWHRYRLARQERLYAKRAKAAFAIAERERELNEFIAHEVRNPLSSAIAALQFVSSKASDPALIPCPNNRESIKSDIQVVDSSLQFVNELLRNMLDMHRSTSKVMKLHMEPTDILRDCFEPIVSILFMRGAKVDVLADCPPNLLVETDRIRLMQIILNLAANSSKFVQQGYIRLRAEVVDNNVLMHVEDSGPGIPAEKQGRMFAKFQESLDVLNQGTGIGLCVCKNLSELMGADLFLDSSFDSGIKGCPGTRFTLRMNKAPLDIENGLFDRMERQDSIQSTKELPESLSVLFVDDDTMIRKMFSRTLKNVAPTWSIREASSGETALRIVDENEKDSFDLIFVDHYMASHTKQLLGTETVQALRLKGVSCVICGLSANDKEEEFLKAGATSFMLKPFPCQKDALKRELIRLLFMREQSLEGSFGSPNQWLDGQSSEPNFAFLNQHASINGGGTSKGT